MQDGKFYQITKEIKSSQVQKKSEIPIQMVDTFDNDVESQKVDSSQPLDQVNDIESSDQQ